MSLRQPAMVTEEKGSFLEDFQLCIDQDLQKPGGGDNGPEFTLKIQLEPSVVARASDGEEEEGSQFSGLMAALSGPPPPRAATSNGISLSADTNVILGIEHEEEKEGGEGDCDDEDDQLYKCDLASCDRLSRNPAELAAHQLETGHEGTLVLQVGLPTEDTGQTGRPECSLSSSNLSNILNTLVI